MRSYLIGHTIFLTSEKYCMTNQKPDTIFFTSEKIRECLLRSLPLPESWLQGLHTLNQWNNLSRTKKTKIQERKLNRMLLCLRNFWCLGTSQDLRRNSPEGAECIAKLIITVRKKDSNEYYEPSSLRSFMASFDWYLGILTALIGKAISNSRLLRLLWSVDCDLKLQTFAISQY